MTPFPDDYDPYGKDLHPVTSGKDMIFRFKRDKDGNITKATVLSKEEAEVERSIPRRRHTK